MWIQATKKIGRHKVGETFKVSRQTGRVYVACRLAKEAADPATVDDAPKTATKKTTTKKRSYKRRDMTAEK